jgi:hypothetical protein
MDRYPTNEEVKSMEDSPMLTSQPVPSPSATGRAARGALGAAAATGVALAALVVIGVISWDAVAGFPGVCICGALGAAAGAALGRLEPRAARIIGGGIGGVIAGYFALAAGEMLPPGPPGVEDLGEADE